MKKTDSPLSISPPIDQGHNRCFWLVGGLLVALMTMIMSRDITRPYYGLHSWAEASGSWAARAHVKYGWGYTHGVSTWAVGEPPPKDPGRYYDHPQLSVNLRALLFWISGSFSEWIPRAYGIVLSGIGLLMVLLISRHLVGDTAAVMAGLLYAIFPITGYFCGVHHADLLYLVALWCYLVLIGQAPDGPEPKPKHLWGLGLALFFMCQMSWPGVFYAATLGLHYLGRALWRREAPRLPVLLILILAPTVSLLLVLAVMAGGYGWDFAKIVELYRWRSAKGEMAEFVWSDWFGTFWEYALSNFSLPVVLTAIAFLLFSPIVRLNAKDEPGRQRYPTLSLSHVWLLLMPGVLQVFTLKGALWKHQTWELPFVSVVAIAAGTGVVLLWRLLERFNRRTAQVAAVALVATCVVSCAVGVNDYFTRRWQTPHKIAMLKMLNQAIPPDKALLSFEPFMTDQHQSKGAFYRPEIAWYLDRQIIAPTTMAELIEALNRRPEGSPQPAWGEAAKLVIDGIERNKDKGTIYIIPEYIVVPTAEGSRPLSLIPIVRALDKKYDRVTVVPQFIPVMPGQVNSPAYYVYDVSRGPEPTRELQP
jgi:hypothetical protein